MPGERRRVGSLNDIFGRLYLLSMHCVILAAVIILLANSPAHLEAQFGCDGHVSQIKKTVLSRRSNRPFLASCAPPSM
jgi:hypothetical protein